MKSTREHAALLRRDGLALLGDYLAIEAGRAERAACENGYAWQTGLPGMYFEGGAGWS